MPEKPANPPPSSSPASRSASTAKPGGPGSAPGTPTDAKRMADAALSAAQQAVSNLKKDASAAGAEGRAVPAPVELPAFDRARAGDAAKGITLLSDVNLNVKIELGRARMLVEDVLKLGEGAVVELDKLAGDPVDVYVNDRPVARGEVLVLNDNFCVRISEIIAGAEDAASGARPR